jgi:hypothetical protein
MERIAAAGSPRVRKSRRKSIGATWSPSHYKAREEVRRNSRPWGGDGGCVVIRRMSDACQMKVGRSSRRASLKKGRVTKLNRFFLVGAHRWRRDVAQSISLAVRLHFGRWTFLLCLRNNLRAVLLLHTLLLRLNRSRKRADVAKLFHSTDFSPGTNISGKQSHLRGHRQKISIQSQFIRLL